MVNEKWLPILGYEGLYEVSDLGRVRSVDRRVAYKTTGGTMLRRGQLIEGVPDKKGYRHLVLCKNGKQRTVFTSRLVAQTFVPNPSNFPDVHHKDFNKSNNSANNLEWVTHQQNIGHSVIEGRYAKKLTAEIVSSIRARHGAGESQASISRDLGLRYQTVHLIVNGHSWCHID